MKVQNSTARHWVQKIVLALSLLFLFSMPLLAQTGGPHHPHHNWNDSIPPPPPPPPLHHGNDSVPPPPPPPPPHHGNDTTPPPPPPPPHGDSLHRCHRDTISGDSTGFRHRNDSLPPPPPPPPPHWGDSTRHCGNDSLGVDIMKLGSNNAVKSSIYPNPVLESAKLHIENASGTLTFNLYGQSGSLVMTMQNVANTDVQFNKGNLMPGIYIYLLMNCNSVVSTGRVVVQ